MTPRERFPSVSPEQRAVRVEQWVNRIFFAAPCRFFIDVPLDMSGVVMAAVREARAAGLSPLPGGEVFATDALYRGAILVEVERSSVEGEGGNGVVRLDGEVLARDLPEQGVRLRAELDELIRWSLDVGQEVTACYVRYQSAASTPGAMRATGVFAAIRGKSPIIEPR